MQSAMHTTKVSAPRMSTSRPMALAAHKTRGPQVPNSESPKTLPGVVAPFSNSPNPSSLNKAIGRFDPLGLKAAEPQALKAKQLTGSLAMVAVSAIIVQGAVGHEGLFDHVFASPAASPEAGGHNSLYQVADDDILGSAFKNLGDKFGLPGSPVPTQPSPPNDPAFGTGINSVFPSPGGAPDLKPTDVQAAVEKPSTTFDNARVE